MQQNWVFIDDGPYLEGVERLVEHYGAVADGLPTRLSGPVPPKPKPPLPEVTRLIITIIYFANCKSVNNISRG